MQVQDKLPHAVSTIEHTWILMPDGVRLAARIWLPQPAGDHPVPAIFEYIPYRRRDSTRARDDAMHGYFAGHGYACVRVDIRGSGDSEGVLKDEYLQSELDDGVAVIDWISRQLMVRRQCRHDRYLLGRIQRPADRRPAAASAQGRDLCVLLRRPLRG